MEIRNKKGEAFIIAIGIGALALLALPFMTPRFRVQKATEKCVAAGGEQGHCKVSATNMSKDEILDYIKDR